MAEISATSRFWQWRIANPLQCCLPDPPPEFYYEQLPDSAINTAQPPSSSSPAPQTSDQSPVPDVDAGIHELIASINDLDGSDSQIENLRSLELRNPPPSVLPHIDPKSRAYCVDCVIDGVEKLRSKRSTLHLAVSCFDRYLSQNGVVTADLHLIGLARLLIAASRSDGGVRDRSQLDWYSRRLCQGTIRHSDLVRATASVLSSLGFTGRLKWLRKRAHRAAGSRLDDYFRLTIDSSKAGAETTQSHPKVLQWSSGTIHIDAKSFFHYYQKDVHGGNNVHYNSYDRRGGPPCYTL